MKVSATIELVWQLAAKESIACEFKEIEPEHFLIGLLKFSELPVEDVNRVGGGAAAARELAAAVASVREVLAERSIDTKQLRRDLRSRLGKGGCPQEGGQKHRSAASRTLMECAARLAADAGSEVLLPIHLLQACLASPTPVMAEMLGGAVGGDVTRREGTPQLDKAGNDLTKLAAAGKIEASAERRTECRALLGLLAETTRKSVLLVSENAEVAGSVWATAACALVGDKHERAGMESRRMVDISKLSPRTGQEESAVSTFDDLLAEAAARPDIILILPQLNVPGRGGEDEWIERLRSALAAGSPQCICHAVPSTLKEILRADAAFGRRVNIMHVRGNRISVIPDEL